jgi:hypothetical protein
MINIILSALILSLPVLMTLDKERLQLSALILLIIFAPIGVEIFFGAPKGFGWALFLFQVISWLTAFKLALNCKRVSDAD